MARRIPTRASESAPPAKSRVREVAGIVLVAFSLALFLALATYHVEDWPNPSRKYGEPTENWIGSYGAYVAHHLMMAMGLTSFFLAAFLVVMGVVVFLHRSYRALLKPLLMLGTVGVFLPVLISLVLDIGSPVTIPSAQSNFGGAFGALLASVMAGNIGRPGAIIASMAVILVAVVVTTNLKPSSAVERLLVWAAALKARFADGSQSSAAAKSARSARSRGAASIDLSDDLPESEPEDESPFLTPPEQPEPPVVREPEITPVRQGPMSAAEARALARAEALLDRGGKTDEDDTGTGDGRAYELPTAVLLDEVPPDEHGESREEMLDNARRLVENLRHFNIEAEVRQITPGPVVTRYELTLAPGIKVGRVTTLSDDLALALKAKGGIRIIAPIPGKAAIGIEVPNRNRSTVYFREIVESEAFLAADQPLVLALGKNTAGETVSADLALMPHLLIAGSTGSGKSVCLNTVLASILMKAPPDKVRMILVDPKVVELSIYNPIPHLLTPVITDAVRAGEALKWAVREMEARYRRLASLGVRDIGQYNDRAAEIAADAIEDEEVPDPLPFIVVIIDEYADLMAISASDIEESIARLAQMARAVGIHLVLATQRPSADVITGLIKANFPSRIAFKVMQASNSRIILDQNGADKLLGMGDMLFLQVGRPEPFRLHGAYISNAESTRLVEHVAAQPRLGTQRITDEMFREESDGGEDNGLGLRDPGERDSLFFKAARLVIRTNQGSVSLLQRRLKIGYARAARLIDQLEIAGVVGPYDGSKARDIMVDEQYIDDMEAGDL